MKILLDTQVFIWIVEADHHLGKDAKRILKDLSNDLYISYFSFYEMSIKASIGKLSYDTSILDDLSDMGIELILPDTSELKSYKVFNPDNKDPFDNMLMNIAIRDNLCLMTSDKKILDTQVDGFKHLDATK